jgi:hypothetical protein
MFNILYIVIWGQNGSVSTLTGLTDWMARGTDLHLERILLYIQWGPGTLSELVLIWQKVCETDCSPASSAEAIYAWNYTVSLPSWLNA